MAKPIKILLILGIVMVSFGMLSLYFFYDPSVSKLFPKCFFYTTTNLHCPGCGTQRALHAIFSGHIVEGFNHNLLLLLVIIVLGYQAFISIANTQFNKHYNNLLHKSKTTKAILVAIILFWILRNIDSYPFSILAP
ncbi:DUF2752 domain-containing protein [Lacinutrix sp. Hel_I_90]|uniref:DUF2752 domain-containing protein n=1 Tax=Lacinutrix sp. Hel_I_90 TaxID=1249999 RepID=UPI0005C85926|nr:DUF2752 domain-containing protein [Lacinutrix sp. Hel_I_90]